jgi:nucleoside-diphosphate-sugar epimerase
MEDACHAAILAAERRAAAGNIFNVTDGAIHTLREIINAMSDALEQSRPKIHLPKGPVRLAAGLIEDGLGLVGKKSPIGRQTIDKFVEDIAVSGDKIHKELGYHSRFDLQTGWRATVRQWATANN